MTVIPLLFSIVIILAFVFVISKIRTLQREKPAPSTEGSTVAQDSALADMPEDASGEVIPGTVESVIYEETPVTQDLSSLKSEDSEKPFANLKMTSSPIETTHEISTLPKKKPTKRAPKVPTMNASGVAKVPTKRVPKKKP